MADPSPFSDVYNQGNLYTKGWYPTTCAVGKQLFNELFWKKNYFLLFLQLSLKLIDNCSSGSARSLYVEIFIL